MLSAFYLELCEKRGWKFVQNAPKSVIKHIISVLQPTGLNKRVNDALKLEKADLKSDYFGFMDFVADKAVIFKEVQPFREYLNSRIKSKVAASKNLKKESIGQSLISGKKTEAVKNARSSDSGKGKKSLPDCLNPKCNDKHYVKNCPTTSEDEAKKL